MMAALLGLVLVLYIPFQLYEMHRENKLPPITMKDLNKPTKDWVKPRWRKAPESEKFMGW